MNGKCVINVDLVDIWGEPGRKNFIRTLAWGDEVNVIEQVSTRIKVKTIRHVDQADGSAAALALAGRVLAAVWVQERDIASADTLAALLAECGLPAARLEASRDAAVQALYQRHTDAAIAGGVFGSPSYVVDGEIFWGQDRLDLLERRLVRA